MGFLSKFIILLCTLVLDVWADQTTTLDPSTNWGTWEGFGVSLAWWATAFGDSTELADIFFSLQSFAYSGTTIPGLGLNIVRYNAGACSFNTIDGDAMVQSPNITPARQVDGYWIDYANSSSASDSWDWTVDAEQRNMMSLAQERGANVFELFSNSPMWWMCINHNPSGSDDGTSDNLQSWNYQQHAYYLATIAQYAKANWGIQFQSVEAFNEPVSAWWTATGTQEGCHFDVATQATVIGYLRTELDNVGLQSTIIAASDENTYDLAISTWNSLGAAATGQVGQINVHGYEYGSGSRDGLYTLASQAGKALWNSEYGEADATGGNLTSNLILDFRWLHPTAWVYWQAIDVSGWGLITGDDSTGVLGAVSQKYFVLAQFTRHIRPGMEIIDGGSDYTVAAYDAGTKTLVIVAVNWGDAQYLNFDLCEFSQPSSDGANVPRWSTQIGSGSQYVNSNDTTVQGTKFWSYFDSLEVQTFEVPNVVI